MKSIYTSTNLSASPISTGVPYGKDMPPADLSFAAKSTQTTLFLPLTLLLPLHPQHPPYLKNHSNNNQIITTTIKTRLKHQTQSKIAPFLLSSRTKPGSYTPGYGEHPNITLTILGQIRLPTNLNHTRSATAPLSAPQTRTHTLTHTKPINTPPPGHNPHTIAPTSAALF